MCNRALGVIEKINAEIERVCQMANAAPQEEGEVAETTETDEERTEREAAELASSDAALVDGTEGVELQENGEEMQTGA